MIFQALIPHFLLVKRKDGDKTPRETEKRGQAPREMQKRGQVPRETEFGGRLPACRPARKRQLARFSLFVQATIRQSPLISSKVLIEFPYVALLVEWLMALAGIGVDMLEIARMEKVLERRPSFAKRVFTKSERAYCERMARPAQHYAARFAAREAVLKALGTGFSRGVGLADVSVRNNEAGRPEVVLSGRAQQIAEEQGVREVALSLSYTHDVAVASAVAMTDEVRPKQEERSDPKDELRASFREARAVLNELERVDEQGA